MILKKVLRFLLISIVTLIVVACGTTDATSNSLPNEFESNAFTFRYPDGWRYQIPQTNMLFLASPEILAQETGATITIQRSLTLSSQTDSPNEALDSYLQRGPLRSDRAWELVTEVETTELDSYETLTVTVEGAEEAGTTPMRSQIYLLQAETTFFFIITLTAPIEQWDRLDATFDNILANINIIG